MKIQIGNGTAYLGDCLERLKELPDNSVDSIITDPPYGLGKEPNPVDVMKGWIEKDYHEIKGKGFMGKEWDAFVPQPIIWKECLRVLKPGGYLLSFAGTRTQDWMAMSLRFAGFEIRDMIADVKSASGVGEQFFDSLNPDQQKMARTLFGDGGMVAWCYGSGFPKSHNIGKAVDKIQGNDIREEKKYLKSGGVCNFDQRNSKDRKLDKGTSEWEGWGTALKPAIEPITMARKPLEKGLNVAQNCLKWGIGGINIDESRVESKPRLTGTLNKGDEIKAEPTSFKGSGTRKLQTGYDEKMAESDLGRFPANLIHDNSEEVKDCFPDTKSGSISKNYKQNSRFDVGEKGEGGNLDENNCVGDSGNASRFFKSIAYQAKASKSERGEGNNHPTVKSLKLMEYLINMVSREGQVVLDPFLGSGTTAIACENTNRKWIGIEKNEGYFNIGVERIKNLHNNK